MGYIYKITNTVNGKVYIGQTTLTVEDRWKAHRYDSKRKDSHCYLHRAIRKYGVDKFVVEEVERCDDCKLNEREQYWIKQYDSFRSGYNLTIGGDGTIKYSDKELLALWESGLSVKQIAKKFNTKSTFYNRLRAIGISNEEIVERGRRDNANAKNTPVYQYDLDGNFIREYSSFKDATKATGIKRIQIKGNKATVCGFQWAYYKTDKIEPDTCKHSSSPKTVYQYSLDGKYIATHKSISAAYRAIGAKFSGGIYAVCHGKMKSTHGYIWSYEYHDEMLSRYEQEEHCKRVAKLDDNGQIICEYSSITEASETHGVSIQAISLVCNGTNQTCCGYKWKFVS